MSLQPICPNPQELGSLAFKVFKAKFIKSARKLAKKHNSADTAVPFFLNAKQKFSDDPEGFLLLFGKMAKWKAHSKMTAVKEPALRGLCYAAVNAETGALTIYLMPVAGKLKSKPALIAKGLKTVAAPSKCQIEIVAGEFTEDMLDKAEAAVENMAEEPDTEDEVEVGMPDPNAGKKPEAPKVPAAVLVGLRQLGQAIAQLESKEAKTKAGKFIREKAIKFIVKLMNTLDKEIEALPEPQKSQVKARKEYVYAKEILDRINKVRADKDKEKEDPNKGGEQPDPNKGGEQPDKITPEDRKEFTDTVAELKAIFSKAGIELAL